jgi:hypothetical protein
MMAPFPIRDSNLDGSEFIVERCATEVRSGLAAGAGPGGVGAPEVEVDVKIFGANTPLRGKRILNARTHSPTYARNFDRCSWHRLFDAPISDAAGPVE